MWRKVQFIGPICFKLVTGILDPAPSSKVALSFSPLSMLMYFFAGLKKIWPCVWPNSGFWCSLSLTLQITLISSVPSRKKRVSKKVSKKLFKCCQNKSRDNSDAYKHIQGASTTTSMIYSDDVHMPVQGPSTTTSLNKWCSSLVHRPSTNNQYRFETIMNM